MTDRKEPSSKAGLKRKAPDGGDSDDDNASGSRVSDPREPPSKAGLKRKASGDENNNDDDASGCRVSDHRERSSKGGLKRRALDDEDNSDDNVSGSRVTDHRSKAWQKRKAPEGDDNHDHASGGHPVKKATHPLCPASSKCRAVLPSAEPQRSNSAAIVKQDTSTSGSDEKTSSQFAKQVLVLVSGV